MSKKKGGIMKNNDLMVKNMIKVYFNEYMQMVEKARLYRGILEDIGDIKIIGDLGTDRGVHVYGLESLRNIAKINGKVLSDIITAKWYYDNSDELTIIATITIKNIEYFCLVDKGDEGWVELYRYMELPVEFEDIEEDVEESED